MIENKNFLTVSQINNLIKDTFEEVFPVIFVVGEVSNFVNHSSGHRYFTLKDANSQISCVLWRGKPLAFTPQNGIKIKVIGKLTVYPPQGKYQIDCERLEQIGIGDKFAQLEELKAKLKAKGYFDDANKKPIPVMPIKIGIATSITGAALHDMKITISRRFPVCELLIRNTLVQGAGSAEDIVLAVEELDSMKLDVIILGRGGGSIEDLWSFNEEIVANAIFKCRTPIISAVGHESDFTLSDLVADLRAATPTAAAELVTRNTKDSILEFLDQMQNSLSQKSLSVLKDYSYRIENVYAKNLTRTAEQTIKTNIQLLDDIEIRIENSIINRITNESKKINMIESHFKALHPLSPLKKGFALLKKDDEYISVNQTLKGMKEIEIMRLNENIKVKIED